MKTLVQRIPVLFIVLSFRLCMCLVGGAGNSFKVNGHENFLLEDTLTDGERERRIQYNGISAKETSVVSYQNGSRSGLSLVQVTDGKRFLQSIYNADGVLQDCEYMKDPKTAREFLDGFMDDAEKEVLYAQGGTYLAIDPSSGLRNVSLKLLPDDDVSGLDPELQRMVEYPTLRRECKKLHKDLKKLAHLSQSPDEETRQQADELVRKKREIGGSSVTMGIMPGTKWCGMGNEAEEFREVGVYTSSDTCCREHDHCPSKIKAFSSEFGLFNLRFHTLSHCDCDDRRKRDSVSILRIPGTRWCGKGFTARTPEELGGYQGADKCCRLHDLHCPFFIESYATKYGLYNWRVYTLNHCSCDERFRTCLKMTNTGAANMVGKVFFNVIQTKCFVLKPERQCRKRSWWGKCLDYGYVKTAHLRDPIPY